MKRILAFAGALALVATASVAHADTVTVNATDGIWSNALPAACCSIDNSTATRTIRWGSGSPQSGYDFTPVAPPAFLATVDGPTFLLGTFVHQNWPIGLPLLSSVDLDFTLDWAGFTPDLAGKFSFTHEETPNSAPCAYPGGAPCADRVTVSSPFLNTNITDGTKTYFFTLVGFSTDGGATTSSQFITQEGLANPAGLYGKLTSIPVPEPTSMFLLGAGLLGLAVRMRRQ